MNNIIKIGLLGESLVGKTSLLNALAGDIISNTGYPKDTDIAKQYMFNRVPSSQGCYKSLLLTRTFTVTDFKHIDATYDKLKDINLFIFITTPDTALTRQEELDKFKKIKEIVDHKINKGVWSDLLVMINKCERLDPLIKDQIHKRATIDHDKIFRVSSLGLLCEHIVHTDTTYYPRDHIQEFYDILQVLHAKYDPHTRYVTLSDDMISDPDCLMKYIDHIDTSKCRLDTMLDRLDNYHISDDLGEKVSKFIGLLTECNPSHLHTNRRFITWIQRELHISFRCIPGSLKDTSVYVVDSLQIHLIYELCKNNLMHKPLSEMDVIKDTKLDFFLQIFIVESDAFNMRRMIKMLQSKRVYINMSIPSIDFKLHKDNVNDFILYMYRCYSSSRPSDKVGDIKTQHRADKYDDGILSSDDEALSRLGYYYIRPWEAILEARSSSTELIYLQNLIKISLEPAENLIITNSAYPDYYRRFFYATPELYPQFKCSLEYSKMLYGVYYIGTNIFIPDRYDLALISDTDIAVLNKEYNYT